MPHDTQLDSKHCQYVYKACHHARAVKKDGSLHRLCASHREKANKLQKRYATKRRQEARIERRRQFQAKKQHVATSSAVPGKHEWWMDLEWTLDELATDLIVLSDEDMAFLSQAF
ncbi:hypothetical protein DYB37_008838 [Aphanomyces astaci]|nr:hypothetical protein AaE_003729 [Aphanomyces astaci]RHY12158.1 hypothetical protein DYB25_005642 [Aphanomyces astaci]RHY59074.1 hypothetical protein DYB30_004446 [Aphanomyces astaci]RHY59300.1 hypothetical protein DYB38_006239 [Aphanomyces astaci]RHY84220.1 hypothetical protein DYB26_007122 [Aphanomyces astaci]